MENPEKLTLLDITKEIIKHYMLSLYNNYLKKHNILKIENIKGFVDSICDGNEIKMKKYIRENINANKNNIIDYSLLKMENIILEIFNDMDVSKQRLILEIENYQLEKETAAP